MTAIKIYALFIFLGLLSCQQKLTDQTESKSSADNNEVIDFWKNYTIKDKTFGTETLVTIKGNNRMMVTNALPNHQTGNFPNEGNPNSISAQSKKYSFPLTPKLSGKAQWAREIGIAINGVKFEPETAERFICETGEQYRIEAVQNLVDLGLDQNNAHVQPTGAYHYHGVPTGLVKVLNSKEDIVLVGFAHDGFPIYYAQSGVYKPSFQLIEESRTGKVCSYNRPHISLEKELQGSSADGTFVTDWEYVAGLGDLDECNGINYKGSYAYFVTDDYPYVGRCLKGEFIQRGPSGPPPGNQPPGEHPHPHPHRN